MITLGIDTSTGKLFVSLLDNEKPKLDLSMMSVKHGEVLPLIVKKLDMLGLSLKDIDLISVGIGPGSFTGLRIGVSFSLGLSFGLNIPIVGVPSLMAKAYSYKGDGLVVSGVDGRRREVFYGVYKKAGSSISVLKNESRVKYEEFPSVIPDGSKVVIDGRMDFLGEMKKLLPMGFLTSDDLCYIGKSLCILGVERFKRVGDEKNRLKVIYLRKSDPEERLKPPL